MNDGRAEFSAVYARHGPAVFRFALYLSGEPAEAEDIAAEAFARAWTSPSPIAAETVRSYLFTIARNVYLQRARKSARHIPLGDELAEARSVEARLDARSDIESIEAQLQRMSDLDRVAIRMRADGSSYEDIAAAIGSSPAAARVRVHRVRAILTRARLGGMKP